jgi:ADP-heptose:LPS heptosyltransferase
MDKNFKTIAVAKYKGLGSIIQATPLLQTLRINYPEAKIIFITSKSNVSILKMINCVDEIIFLDDTTLGSLLRSFFPFLIKLINSRIELLFDLEIYSNFSSLITTLSMAKNRVGYYLRSSNYRLGIYTHMMYYNISVPISQTYLQLARLTGAPKIVPGLYPLQGNSSPIEIDGQLFDLKQNKYLLINPNASDLRLERRWGAEKFKSLIESLRKKLPEYKIILIGGKAEKEYVDQICNSLKSQERILNFSGSTSMEQLVCLIKEASVFVTNDTGPMHIAFSLKTKTVALFGPCSPNQYGVSEFVYPIYHKVYCSPCVHEFILPPCNGNNQCMKLIEVSEVLKGTEAMLNETRDLSTTILKDEIIYVAGNDAEKKFPLGFITR